MKKKLASVLLCAVMAASMLTGCGNADNATATTPATDNTQQQLPRRQRRPQRRPQRQQALYTI